MLHIFKETLVEDTLVSRHSVGHVELRGDMVSVGVTSFQPSETGMGPSFYRTLQMPIADFNAAPYPQNVYDWLTLAGNKLAGGTVVAGDEPSLPEKQLALLRQVEILRDEAIHSGMAVGTAIYDTDADSIRNITGKALKATTAIVKAETGWSTPWKLADNTMTTLDADGMIAVGEALDAHITASYARSWELKAEIAAATEETIDTIDVTAGWPVPTPVVPEEPPAEEPAPVEEPAP